MCGLFCCDVEEDNPIAALAACEAELRREWALCCDPERDARLTRRLSELNSDREIERARASKREFAFPIMLVVGVAFPTIVLVGLFDGGSGGPPL